MTETKVPISWRTNAALIAYGVGVSTIHYFFRPKSRPVIPFDAFYDKFPLLAVLTAVLLVVLALFLGAMAVRLFWVRFVSNICGVREITTQEALSLVLVVSIVAELCS
jgi:uncharacterized membrane protein YidH (DUF202 family)